MFGVSLGIEKHRYIAKYNGNITVLPKIRSCAKIPYCFCRMISQPFFFLTENFVLFYCDMDGLYVSTKGARRVVGPSAIYFTVYYKIYNSR